MSSVFFARGGGGVNWDGTQWSSTDKCYIYCANTCDWNGAAPDEGGGCFPKYDMVGYKIYTRNLSCAGQNRAL